jgi:hypothetical protein
MIPFDYFMLGLLCGVALMGVIACIAFKPNK